MLLFAEADNRLSAWGLKLNPIRVLLTEIPCMFQAAKQDLVQQGWKGFYLGGNYVSGTALSLAVT